ncbi:MAG: hypothetical protein R2860_07555 [Desulfobacterales bacterium]
MGGTTPTEYECKMEDKEGALKHVIIRFNITQWHERIMATIEYYRTKTGKGGIAIFH